MQCPEDAVFQQLITDSLPDSEVDGVSSHLSTCVDCCTRLEEIAAGRLLKAAKQDTTRQPTILDTSECADAVVQRVLSRVSPTSNSGSESTGVDAAQESTLWQFLSNQLDPPRTDGAVNRLDHYDILGTIGEGGMGIVVKARDTKLDRVVALKIISPVLASSHEARQRFFREAKAAAAIEHENVVTIYGVEEWRGIAYLVMPYVDGQTLQQLVDTEGALSADRVLEFGEQIAHGLAAAHAGGLVHRDIKPSNILIQRPDDRVVITDFGLARSQDDTVLTRSGAVAGTPQFMSPEQATGEPVDHRSDLYSIGSVLYFLSTGRYPWSGNTAVSILRQICDEVPASVMDYSPTVPAPLQAVISKLMSRDPNDRFASASEVAGIIRAARSGDPLTELQPPLAATFFRNRLTLTVILLVLVAVIGWRYVPQNPGVEHSVEPPGKLVASTPDSNSNASLPSAATPSAFRIVGSQRSYARLTDAVRDAENGAVIEIHDDGPFAAESVNIKGKALTIQAGPSSRPVVTISDPSAGERGNWLSTDSDLVIRNIRVIDTAQTSTPSPVGNEQRNRRSIFCVIGATLTIESCHLQTSGNRTCVCAVGANCRMVNSSLIGLDYLTINWVTLDGGLEFSFDNCVLQSSQILQVYVLADAQPSSLKLRNSTVVGNAFARFMLPDDIRNTRNALTDISVANTVMNARLVCRLLGFRKADREFYESFQSDTAGSLRRILNWNDEGTVYSREVAHFLDVRHTAQNIIVSSDSYPGPVTVPEWMRATGQSQDAAVSAFVVCNEDFAADDLERYRLEISDVTGPADGATTFANGQQPGANIDSVGPQMHSE